MGGLRVTPDTAAEALRAEAFDGLVLCGGMIWETEKAPDLKPVIDDFMARGKLAAGICGATLALAKAGALNNAAHTSNALRFIADLPVIPGMRITRTRRRRCATGCWSPPPVPPRPPLPPKSTGRSTSAMRISTSIF